MNRSIWVKQKVHCYLYTQTITTVAEGVTALLFIFSSDAFFNIKTNYVRQCAPGFRIQGVLQ